MPSAISQIKKAAQIADIVLEQFPDVLKPGLSEKQVASTIRKIIRVYGGQKESFRTIVASGSRSSMVHGYATEKKIRAGEPVIVDFGVVYNGYCSDITRTFIVPFAKSQRHSGVYNNNYGKAYLMVKAAQAKAIGLVRAGAKAASIDNAVRKVFKRHGVEKFFPHSTGHGICRQVHEQPRISYKSDETLREGMIITIEPGLYFGKNTRLAGSRPFGIRIEDMVLVTKTGCRLLTKAHK
jgi:Xaa-Pro aminopeptidase